MSIGNSQSIFFLSTPAYLCAAFKGSLQLEPEVTLTASENLGLFSFSENLHPKPSSQTNFVWEEGLLEGKQLNRTELITLPKILC